MTITTRKDKKELTIRHREAQIHKLSQVTPINELKPIIRPFMTFLLDDTGPHNDHMAT